MNVRRIRNSRNSTARHIFLRLGFHFVQASAVKSKSGSRMAWFSISLVELFSSWRLSLNIQPTLGCNFVGSTRHLFAQCFLKICGKSAYAKLSDGTILTLTFLKKSPWFEGWMRSYQQGSAYTSSRCDRTRHAALLEALSADSLLMRCLSHPKQGGLLFGGACT